MYTQNSRSNWLAMNSLRELNSLEFKVYSFEVKESSSFLWEFSISDNDGKAVSFDLCRSFRDKLDCESSRNFLSRAGNWAKNRDGPDTLGQKPEAN